MYNDNSKQRYVFVPNLSSLISLCVVYYLIQQTLSIYDVHEHKWLIAPQDFVAGDVNVDTAQYKS